MKPLRSGDTVGIVSPASRADEAIYSPLRNFFESRGFPVKLFGREAPAFGKMAATDLVRARAVEDAFGDHEVRAVLCTRGGYGSGRLLDILNLNQIAANPKIFIGYSDITNLLVTFRTVCGLYPFHGPMAVDLLTKSDPWTIEHFFSTLAGEFSGYYLDRRDFQPIRCGVARGRLLGGNISILESMIGTGAFHADEPTILLLEDVGEFMFRLDRALVHFHRVGIFDNVTGVIFSDMRLNDRGPDNSLGIELEELIRMHFDEFTGPVAIDLPFGHTQQQMTMPLGAHTMLSVESDRLRLCFSDFWSTTKTAAKAA